MPPVVWGQFLLYSNYFQNEMLIHVGLKTPGNKKKQASTKITIKNSIIIRQSIFPVKLGETWKWGKKNYENDKKWKQREESPLFSIDAGGIEGIFYCYYYYLPLIQFNEIPEQSVDPKIKQL